MKVFSILTQSILFPLTTEILQCLLTKKLSFLVVEHLIMFELTIDPQEVIDFINANFDLNKSTSGFERVYLGVHHE